MLNVIVHFIYGVVVSLFDVLEEVFKSLIFLKKQRESLLLQLD